MIKPVDNKKVAILPAKAMSRLNGLTPIRTFEYGRDHLFPAINKFFDNKLKDVLLDNPAKVRLLAMDPSLEQRAEKESLEAILSSLELSHYITEDRTLYILGGRDNINFLEDEEGVLLFDLFSDPNAIKFFKDKGLEMYDISRKKGQSNYGKYESIECFIRYDLPYMIIFELELRKASGAGYLDLEVLGLKLRKGYDYTGKLEQVAKKFADISNLKITDRSNETGELRRLNKKSYVIFKLFESLPKLKETIEKEAGELDKI